MKRFLSTAVALLALAFTAHYLPVAWAIGYMGLVRVFQSGVVGPIRIYKRARPADAPKPLGDPEQKHADIVRLADEVAQAMATEAQASADEARAAAVTSGNPGSDPGDEPSDR